MGQLEGCQKIQKQILAYLIFVTTDFATKQRKLQFLSNPVIPGVRSMGSLVSNKQTKYTFLQCGNANFTIWLPTLELMQVTSPDENMHMGQFRVTFLLKVECSGARGCIVTWFLSRISRDAPFSYRLNWKSKGSHHLKKSRIL